MLVFWVLLAAHCIAAVVGSVVVLLRPSDPRGMLAWILALVLFPGVGVLAFCLGGEPRKGWYRRRRRQVERRLGSLLVERAGVVLNNLHGNGGSDPASASELTTFARRVGAFPATRGNHVTPYHDAEETFDALLAAIGSARSHIHLEYYIFQPDETGAEVRDLLIEKARQGVACRVLLDFVGSWWTSNRFLRPLRESGAKIEFTFPVVPWRGRFRANFRNHRKIAVIDGRIGFFGSQNIGDEYRGRLSRHGPWRDTHFRAVGPCVHHLQEVFVEDWWATTHEELASSPEHFPEQTAQGEHVVQIAASGPGANPEMLHHLLFAAVGTARQSIRIITPYFAPDLSMVLSLRAAAFRGVRVQIVLPSTTDQPLTLWAARSFYPDLIDAGVEVYERDDVLLHSKVMIVDGSWALVGSANIDVRSFKLNFELTSFLGSRELADVLSADFEEQRAASRRVTERDIDARGFGESLLLGCARIVSPIL